MLKMFMDFDFRFGGIRRLYGDEAFNKLTSAHICIIGLGGVGSWTVESLARTGVGEFTLVDMDDVCESNINRQLQAVGNSIGKTKTDELSQRIKLINPNCKVNIIFDFFTLDTADEILKNKYDLVVDCIDNPPNKCLLLTECLQREIPVVTTGGAGGKRDPLKIQIADLADTRDDLFLKLVRRELRRKFGFRNKKGRFGIDCVFSPEEPNYPAAGGCITKEKPKMDSTKLDCASGFGAVTHLTGSFGFAISHLVVQKIIQ